MYDGIEKLISLVGIGVFIDVLKKWQIHDFRFFSIVII